MSPGDYCLKLKGEIEIAVNKQYNIILYIVIRNNQYYVYNNMVHPYVCFRVMMFLKINIATIIGNI